ncbi:MAG: hypothetical protein H6729_11725 [Deltaproteobacteria bacterium]|nr:hypothetical protein [Deltaproteobacteria bacterium]
MTTVRNAQRAITTAAEYIADADEGSDGTISRSDMKTGLERMATTARTGEAMKQPYWTGGSLPAVTARARAANELVDEFYRFAASREAPGGRVTTRDLYGAPGKEGLVAFAQAHLVGDADENQDGVLDAGEKAAMHPVGVLAARYADLNEVAQAKSAAAEAKLDKLFETLDTVRDHVENHDWDAFIAMFPADIVAAQAEIGIDKAQFLAEAIGVGDLVYGAGPDDRFSGLNKIQSVSFNESGGLPKLLSSTLVSVDGTATMADGTTRPLSLLFDEHESKPFTLTSAVG